MHIKERQEAQQVPAKAPPLKSLRDRVFVLLLAALLPVVLLNLLTTYSRFADAKQRSRNDLQDVSQIVTDEIDHYLNNAFALLTILGEQPEVLSRERSCPRFLAGALKGFYGYSNLFVVDPVGRVACSARAPAHEISFADQPWWQKLHARGGPIVGGPTIEPASGEQAVIIALPLNVDATGRRGAIALALKDTTLQHLRRLVRVRSATLLFVLNDSGTIILGPTDKDSLAKLPADPRFLTRTSTVGQVFDEKARSGEAYVYAVVPMLEGKVFGIVAQAGMNIDAPRFLALSEQALLPILLTAGILAIVWIGTDRIVLRWIRHLTAVAIAYRRGHMAVRPKNMEDAPAEIQQLGETLSSMASSIEVREARLKDTIRQCEHLIREVHHRVKNNLQVIASLLNLQARAETMPDARRALRAIQVRVEAIALVHRNIYLADEVEYVNLQDLAPAVAHQVSQFLEDGDRHVTLFVEAETIWLTVDRAIPVSQFIVEALSNSYGHAFPDNGAGQISISLRVDSGQACLTIADNGIGLPPQSAVPRQNHIGHALMQSLARQIGGSAELKSQNGTQSILHFTYRAPDIAPMREKDIEFSGTSALTSSNTETAGATI